MGKFLLVPPKPKVRCCYYILLYTFLYQLNINFVRNNHLVYLQLWPFPLPSFCAGDTVRNCWCEGEMRSYGKLSNYALQKLHTVTKPCTCIAHLQCNCTYTWCVFRFMCSRSSINCSINLEHSGHQTCCVLYSYNMHQNTHLQSWWPFTNSH